MAERSAQSAQTASLSLQQAVERQSAVEGFALALVHMKMIEIAVGMTATHVAVIVLVVVVELPEKMQSMAAA